MSEPSIETLKREALEVFGMALTDEQVEMYKGRLPTMLENVRLLQGWAARLGSTGPAQILQMVETRDAGGAIDDR